MIGYDAVVVDFDASDVSGLVAGKNISNNMVFTFHLVRADYEQMPFRDKSFDVAFASQVLHHAEDLNRIVSEVARVTKGVLIVIDEPKRGFSNARIS